MDGCIIRPAGPEDVTTLVALDSFAMPDNGRVAEIADWVEAGHCFCAWVDGVAAGYAVMHRHFFGQPMLELVMVGTGFRRRGVGQALIAHAINAVAPTVLWTSTNQSNHAMQSLLENMSFELSGIVKGLDAGDPELIYRYIAPPSIQD